MSFSALFTPCLFDADRAQWIDSSVDANGPFFKSGCRPLCRSLKRRVELLNQWDCHN